MVYNFQLISVVHPRTNPAEEFNLSDLKTDSDLVDILELSDNEKADLAVDVLKNDGFQRERKDAGKRISHKDQLIRALKEKLKTRRWGKRSH